MSNPTETAAFPGFQRIPLGWLKIGLVLVFGLTLAAAFYFESWLMLLLPFGLAMAAWGVRDFRLLYLSIWFTIPFAIEVDLPGGLSTDFPAEPLMWLSCLLFLVYLFLNHHKISFRFILHPVFILLMIHFFWIIFTTVTSTEPMMSLKYTLAKSWYLLCFVAIPLVLFRDVLDYRQWGIVLVVPLVATIIIILYRHYQLDFTFSTINNAVIPIYRNHVDYACCLGILLAVVWFLRSWFDNKWIKRFLYVSLGLMVMGIYFSYTRAAWVCIPLSFAAYFVIRLRLMRVAIPLMMALAFALTAWLASNNNYIGFSPNYEKTITHKSFDDLVTATYQLEDISTVERFYRWIAGFYMVKEKPWTGFGPASFYTHYHSYVDRHFTTYVSDNPEHSGMHNYYLMIAVEQGLIGLLIFLVLVIVVLLVGERTYHRLTDKRERQLLMAMLISFTCNLFILTLNDTIETDKLGTFFFMNIAVVIWLSQRKSVMVRLRSPQVGDGSTSLTTSG